MIRATEQTPFLDQVLAALRDADDWLTAAELARYMGLPNNESTKRVLRMAAEDSQGAIAGGQQGYKLTERLSTGEYLRTKHWFIGQAVKMIRRAKQFQHRRTTSQMALPL
jgi:hypothetical protein